MKGMIPANMPLNRKHILAACKSAPYEDDLEQVVSEINDLADKLHGFLAQYGHDIQDARFKIHRVGTTRAAYWPDMDMALEFADALLLYIGGDLDNGWKPRVRRPKPGTFHDGFFQEFLDWYSTPHEGREYDQKAHKCDPARKDFQEARAAGKALRDDMPRRECFNARYDAIKRAKNHLKESDYSWVPEQYFYLWAEHMHPLPGTEPIECPDLDRCIDLGKRNELAWPAWVPESIKDPDYIRKFFVNSPYC